MYSNRIRKNLELDQILLSYLYILLSYGIYSAEDTTFTGCIWPQTEKKFRKTIHAIIFCNDINNNYDKTTQKQRPLYILKFSCWKQVVSLIRIGILKILLLSLGKNMNEVVFFSNQRRLCILVVYPFNFYTETSCSVYAWIRQFW